VVWATGYRDDISWIKIDQAVKDGRIVEDRGVSPVPGLFYCGRSWQSCRASALLCGAAGDAKRIAALVRETLGD
jgi:putative flavoprotein involved in K+ transport